MPAKAPLSRYALVLIAAVTVVVLLSLAWPRLQASLRYLPVDTALSKYWQTRQPDKPQLPGLIERAQQAIGLYDHYRYWEGLSALQLLSGQDQDMPYWQRRQMLKQSIASALEVVQRAPAQPQAWLRIARTRAFLGAAAEDILPAWKMSVLTGRVEPTLMLARLELGFGYYGLLDEESLALLRDQTVLTWAVQPRGLVQSLQSGRLDIGLLRNLLEGRQAGMLVDMEAQLAK